MQIFKSLFSFELKRILKSPLFVIVMALSFAFVHSQMGADMTIQAPDPKADHYDYTYTDDYDIIKNDAIKDLIRSYGGNSYATYPMGFYRSISLEGKDDQTMAKLIASLTGSSIETIQKLRLPQITSEDIQSLFNRVEVYELSQKDFYKAMNKVDDLIGGGSSFDPDTIDYQFGRVEMTYQEALKAYEDILKKDRVTGSIGRLMNDYLGLMMFLLPVFLVTMIWHKDNKGNISDLIYTRKISSRQLVFSRSMALMTALILISLLIASFYNIMALINNGFENVGLFRIYAITLLWQAPIIFMVIAMTSLVTLLSSRALAVPLMFILWFVTMLLGSSILVGDYGMKLVLRHNSLYEGDLFSDHLPMILVNRFFWISLALLILLFCIRLYQRKRQGRLAYGKN
jgi:ABC-type transport system involved in multi-copper enzyme maturation permease subunit